MRREFLINIFLLVLINLLIKPFYTFFIETEVQNRVGPEEYGIYFAIFNFTYLFQIVMDLGIQNYGSQHVAKDKRAVSVFLADTLGLKLLLSLLYYGVIMSAAFFLGYRPEIFLFIFLVAVNHFLTGFVSFFRATIAALGQYRWNTFLSVLEKIFMITGLGFLLWFYEKNRELTIMDFVMARMAAFILALLFSILLLTHLGHSLKFQFDWKRTKRILLSSYPFALVILLMTIYNRIDAIMLERMLGDHGLSAGIYAAAYRLFHAVSAFGVFFSMLLLPMFAHLFVTDKVELVRLMTMALNWLLTVAVLVALSTWMAGGQIMSFLYKQDAELYGTDVVLILMISFFFVSVIYIYGTLITANGRLRELNGLFVFGILINIAINFWLIPGYGPVGAAMATLFTQAFVAIGEIIICYKCLHIHIKASAWIRLVIFCVLSCISYYVINDYFATYLMAWSVVVAGIAGLLIAIITKTIDLIMLKELILNRLQNVQSDGE